MFHQRDGLYFDRLPNGDVHILKTVDGRARSSDAPKLFEQVIPAGEWESVIATVSAGGESDSRWYLAKAFHASTGPQSLVPLGRP